MVELKVQKKVMVSVQGQVLCTVEPTSELGELFEFKLRHNDGSWRTSIFSKEELEAIGAAIEEVLS